MADIWRKISNTFKDVGHNIAPIVSPIKNVFNATTAPILAGLNGIGALTTNIFKVGQNLGNTAVSLTSGNTLLYIGIFAGGLAIIYVLKK